MFALRWIPSSRCCDLCYDWSAPFSWSIYFGFYRFSSLHLFFAKSKNSRAVLAAIVISLLVQCSGVVHAEEPLFKKFLERKNAGIEHNLDRLCMTRIAIVCIVILGVFEPTPCVSRLGFMNTGNFTQDVFHPPETTTCEVNCFEFHVRVSRCSLKMEWFIVLGPSLLRCICKKAKLCTFFARHWGLWWIVKLECNLRTFPILYLLLILDRLLRVFQS